MDNETRISLLTLGLESMRPWISLGDDHRRLTDMVPIRIAIAANPEGNFGICEADSNRGEEATGGMGGSGTLSRIQTQQKGTLDEGTEVRLRWRSTKTSVWAACPFGMPTFPWPMGMLNGR